jgi:hypothetical protein
MAQTSIRDAPREERGSVSRSTPDRKTRSLLSVEC